MNRDNLSNKLFVYDPTTNEWTEGANLPTERGALTANFINGILYAVGGVDKSEALTSTLAYDRRTNTWTEKAPMPTAREHLTSATINGKLYVIGGRTAGMSTNVDANEVCNQANNKWTVLQPMLSKRGGLLLLRQSMKLSTYLVENSQVARLTIMKNMIHRLTNGHRRNQCQLRDMD